MSVSAATLDFETRAVYLVTFVATDTGTPVLTNATTVNITLMYVACDVDWHFVTSLHARRAGIVMHALLNVVSVQ